MNFLRNVGTTMGLVDATPEETPQEGMKTLEQHIGREGAALASKMAAFRDPDAPTDVPLIQSMRTLLGTDQPYRTDAPVEIEDQLSYASSMSVTSSENSDGDDDDDNDDDKVLVGPLPSTLHWSDEEGFADSELSSSAYSSDDESSYASSVATDDGDDHSWAINDAAAAAAAYEAEQGSMVDAYFSLKVSTPGVDTSTAHGHGNQLHGPVITLSPSVRVPAPNNDAAATGPTVQVQLDDVAPVQVPVVNPNAAVQTLTTLTYALDAPLTPPTQPTAPHVGAPPTGPLPRLSRGTATPKGVVSKTSTSDASRPRSTDPLRLGDSRPRRSFATATPFSRN